MYVRTYTRMRTLLQTFKFAPGAKALSTVKAVMTARQKILETTSSGMYSVVFSVTIMTLIYSNSNSNGKVYYLYNNHAI